MTDCPLMCECLNKPVEYPYYSILLGSKKKWTIGIHNNKDESQGYYAEWKIQGHILSVLYSQNNNIDKK